MRIRLHVATLHEGEVPLGSLVQADGESGKILLPKLGPRIHAGSGDEKELLQKQEEQILEGFCRSQGINSTAVEPGDGVAWGGRGSSLSLYKCLMVLTKED